MKKEALTSLALLVLAAHNASGGEAKAEFEFPDFGDTSPLAGPIELAANEIFSKEGLDVTVDVRAAGDDILIADYSFSDSAVTCADIEANISTVNSNLGGGIGTARIISCSDGGGGGESKDTNFLGTEIEAGSSWYWSEWLEAFNSSDFPWIWTVAHGWWWVDGNDDSEIYAYSLDRGAWLYTGADIYPWVYDWKDQQWINLSAN